MALDDKLFQSAIAKINKIKARQPTTNQIAVFDDPPHLKKQNENIINTADVDATLPNNTITQRSNNILKPQIASPESIPTLHGSPASNFETIHTNKLENEHSSIQKLSTDDNINRVHKQGTEALNKVHKKGTTLANRVHKKDTLQGTEIGYKNSINNNHPHPVTDEEYSEFIYQRPYDSLFGISKKIVDAIFEICKKYGGNETPPLPLAMLVRLCNEKKNSVKVTRQRLIEEQIIGT